MPRCNFATWVPIAATNQDRNVYEKTQVILHTIVGTARGTIEAWRRTNDTEATFVIALDGSLFQCMDSASRADANRNANRSAISIETEDRGSGRGEWDPDRVWLPWTDAQLSTIVRLLEWCHQAHGIPMDRCATPTSPGVGYHTMWGAPSPWTPVAKTCPGVARIRQFDTSIQAFLDGRPMPDGADIRQWTQRPLSSLSVDLRQRLIEDERYPLPGRPRRSRRRPTAGRPR
jgi:N-acetyl-anhydromuramyl-L-alanine amidase AmpD